MGARFLALGLAAILLAACVPDPNIYGPYPGRPGQPGVYGPQRPPAVRPPVGQSAAQQFFATLKSYCGQAFAGRVVTNDPEDQTMRANRLVLDLRACSGREIRMPFAQGENRSRTWIVTRRGPGLAFKHDHRGRNGRSEPITMYGGDTVDGGTPVRQEFPADAYSSEMFFQAKRPESAQNIWALEVMPGRYIAYELRRSGRYLRIEFDVTRPLGPQPAPWGWRQVNAGL